MTDPVDNGAASPQPEAGALDQTVEVTAISSRRVAPATDAGIEDTVRSAESGDEPPGPRRSSPDGAGPIESVDDDGSTVVAHRESRRRRQAGGSAATSLSADEGIDGTAVATRAGGGRGLATTLAADVPAPLGRVARAPETSAPTPVRAPGPVIVARAAPVAAAPQDFVDTAAAEDERRRRSRRTGALVVVTASLLAAGAATALVVLMLTT